MKAVILAGGFGTRLMEETSVRPKPMVEIGGRPILWHIMKLYEYAGVTEFVICCGYKAYYVKEYFVNYALHNSNVSINLRTNTLVTHSNNSENWTVTLVDTGDHSMTGGRLGRVREFVDSERFFFTYGDGVADIDVNDVLTTHLESGSDCTMTVTQPPGRYGSVAFGSSENDVVGFTEKPSGDGAWINCGFFVVEPNVLEMIEADTCIWETDILPTLAESGNLSCHRHTGFWHPMDTLRDKQKLEALWDQSAPWAKWRNS